MPAVVLAGVAAHHHDHDVVADLAGEDVFGECPNHVTRALQSTWEASDVEGAWG